VVVSLLYRGRSGTFSSLNGVPRLRRDYGGANPASLEDAFLRRTRGRYGAMQNNLILGIHEMRTCCIINRIGCEIYLLLF
jgi:hypothetical protein